MLNMCKKILYIYYFFSFNYSEVNINTDKEISNDIYVVPNLPEKNIEILSEKNANNVDKENIIVDAVINKKNVNKKRQTITIVILSFLAIGLGFKYKKTIKNPSPIPNNSAPNQNPAPAPNPLKTNYSDKSNEEIFNLDDEKINNILYKYNKGEFTKIDFNNIKKSDSIILELKENTSKFLETLIRIEKNENIQNIYIILDNNFIKDNPNEKLKTIYENLNSCNLLGNTIVVVYNDQYQNVTNTDFPKKLTIKKIDDLNEKFRKFLQILKPQNTFQSRIG